MNQIILHNRNLLTLSIALSQMIGVYNQEYSMRMAGTLISMLPVMLLFLLLQKEFVVGLMASSIMG